jgi:hypothetical protein
VCLIFVKALIRHRASVFWSKLKPLGIAKDCIFICSLSKSEQFLATWSRIIARMSI